MKNIRENLCNLYLRETEAILDEKIPKNKFNDTYSEILQEISLLILRDVDKVMNRDDNILTKEYIASFVNKNLPNVIHNVLDYDKSRLIFSDFDDTFNDGIDIIVSDLYGNAYKIPTIKRRDISLKQLKEGISLE